MTKPTLSIIFPCRNEAASIGTCVLQARAVCEQHNISTEIIVSDSSADDSANIAQRAGARVIVHGKTGYGHALRAGFDAATGEYLLCADADASYDLYDIPSFLRELKAGADIVIGMRNYQPGSTPWLHQYVGVPLTRWLIQVLYGGNVKDPHCGLRGLSRTAYTQLDLQSTGMEYASEMVVQSLRHGLTISQLPTTYFPRIGESKLRTWADGWRHVRLLFQTRV